MARRQSLRSIPDVSAFEEEDAPSRFDLPNLRASGERTLAPLTITDGRSPALVSRRFQGRGPGSEECGSEEQLGPREIGQFFLHGYANRLPRTAHDPLIYGGERPHNCGSELL